jgi:hypothetical protein
LMLMSSVSPSSYVTCALMTPPPRHTLSTVPAHIHTPKHTQGWSHHIHLPFPPLARAGPATPHRPPATAHAHTRMHAHSTHVARTFEHAVPGERLVDVPPLVHGLEDRELARHGHRCRGAAAPNPLCETWMRERR